MKYPGWLDSQPCGIDLRPYTSAMSHTLECVAVSAPGFGYNITIGPDQLTHIDTALAPLKPTRLALLSNESVLRLHGGAVIEACKRVAPTDTLLVQDGEGAKSWTCLGHVLDQLAQQRLDRRSVIVALGGGVVGDLAGFAAAVYMRGIRFVQVPTTLLAQVDSSVGGKTGINLAQGKNLVGAFHQPVAVIADTNTLRTLPPRELSAGLAEVIKHGLLADATYLSQIERDMPALLSCDHAALTRAVAGSCRIKAAIVSRDEREAGERALLNLGHTFGHAIEALAGYGVWLHGEAVAMGLCLAADLSRHLGLITHNEVQRVRQLVKVAKLPTTAAGLSCADMIDAMRADKKAYAGQINFVVLTRLGQAASRQVDDAVVTAVLKDNGFA